VVRKPEEFEKTILFLSETLGGHQYAFRGTASLVLQGIEMNVDDIDILCDEETALACNDLFQDFVLEKVSFKESPQFKSYFGKFRVNNILVEVMGEWQIKDTKGRWSDPFRAAESEREEIVISGQKVSVTTIETELSMFARLGRWNAYHKIKRQVGSQKNTSEQQSLF